MRTSIVLSIFSAILVGAACSASPGNKQFTGGEGPGGAGTGSGTGGELSLGGGFVGQGGSVPGDGCAEEAKLVYLLSTDNKIRSFDPGKKEFGQPFSLSCPVPNDGNDWQPNSMAVDRNAIAWVNYVGTSFAGDAAGLLFEVDLAKKTCAPTPTVHLPSEWFRVGMGFSTDSAGGTSETLWVTGTSSIGQSPGLGKIEMASKLLHKSPGPFNGDPLLAGQDAELTGTGDAKLFGFFTTSPVRVAELDKASAKILSSHTVGNVPKPNAWAFSFWGGAFYFYTSDGFATSTITRYDASTNQVDGSYVLNAGAIVVGAGVSTCAPLKPPS